MILIYEPSIQGKFLFVNRKQNGYHKRRGSSAKFRPYPEPFSLKILIRNFCVCTLARRQRGHQPLFSGFYRRPRTSSPSSHPGSSAIYVYVAVWHSQTRSSVPDLGFACTKFCSALFAPVL